MKRKLFIVLIVCLAAFMLGVSCSNKKGYLGKWSFTEKSISDLVDLYASMTGTELTSANKSYIEAIFKASYAEYETLLYIDLAEDGTCVLSTDGEAYEANYTIDESTYVLTVEEDGISIPFGTFSSDYTKLSILSMDGFNLYKK